MDSRKYNDKDDKELLTYFYQDRNNEWLGIILQRYTLLIYGVCMKYLKNEEDAKDSVQQIFLKVISELHKYKVDYFKSWLYMIAKNHCLMKLRDKHGITAELNENHLKYSDVNDGITAEQKDSTFRNMESALENLNHEQKVCIKEFYLEKKSYLQIANDTGFTVMQVKSHIQNGKRNLKIQLEKMTVNEK